jgi:hypothetical protein
MFLHFREISSFFSASGLWKIEKLMGDASAPALLNEKYNDKKREASRVLHTHLARNSRPSSGGNFA